MTPARRMAVVVLGLAAGALCLWVSSQLVWLRVNYQSPLRGPVTVPATGAELAPALTAVALFALAAVAALVAVGGGARRVIAVLVALTGGWAAWLAVSELFGGVPAELAGQLSLPAGAALAGPPARTAAPVLALLSGLVLIASAAALARWARMLPGMGRKYASPGSARRRPDRDTVWWRAMDEGQDPTLKETGLDPGPPR